MKIKLILIISIASFLLGTGCAFAPRTDNVTFAEIRNADHGKLPSDWRAQLDGYLRGVMIDPTSYLLEIEKGPYKAWSEGYKRVNGQWISGFGWGVAYRLNGKNRLGGYVGWKHRVAFFKNGRIETRILDLNDIYYFDRDPAEWSEDSKPVEWLVPSDSVQP